MLLALSMTCSYVAVAAVVSMQQPDAGGGTLRIPVVLYGDGDEQLSGLQFDLHYDATHYELVEVSSGAAAHEAGKEVLVSAPAAGTGRVLITGFNNNALYDGHVATLVLRARGTSESAHTLAVENLHGSDPLGYEVPVAYEDWYAFPPKPPEKAEQQGAAGEPTEGTDASEGAAEEGPSALERNASGTEPATTGDADADNASTPRAVAGGVRPPDENYVVLSRPAAGNAATRPPPGTHGAEEHPAPGQDRADVRGKERSRAHTGTGQSAAAPVTAGSRGLEAGTPRPGQGAIADGHAFDAPGASRETRLAFLAPGSETLAPSGTTLHEGLRGANAATSSTWFHYRLGAVVAFGLVLFAMLVALRAWVIEPAGRRWRRR